MHQILTLLAIYYHASFTYMVITARRENVKQNFHPRKSQNHELYIRNLKKSFVYPISFKPKFPLSPCSIICLGFFLLFFDIEEHSEQ